MPIINFPTYPDKVTGKEIIIGLEARGTIAKTRTYQISYASPKDGLGPPERVQSQYPYVKRINPGTGPQLVRQQIFADGVVGWLSLDPGDKEPWNAKANKEFRERGEHPGTYKARSGFNLYMRDYLNKH